MRSSARAVALARFALGPLVGLVLHLPKSSLLFIVVHINPDSRCAYSEFDGVRGGRTCGADAERASAGAAAGADPSGALGTMISTNGPASASPPRCLGVARGTIGAGNRALLCRSASASWHTAPSAAATSIAPPLPVTKRNLPTCGLVCGGPSPSTRSSSGHATRQPVCAQSTSAEPLYLETRHRSPGQPLGSEGAQRQEARKWARAL